MLILSVMMILSMVSMLRSILAMMPLLPAFLMLVTPARIDVIGSKGAGNVSL